MPTTTEKEELNDSISLRINSELKEKFLEKCHWERVNKSDLIRNWIKLYAKKPSKNQPSGE